MMSSTAKYALRAVVFLAAQPDQYINRAAVSEATRVPYEYLLKVLHQLDAAGLIDSRRGPNGGYRLRERAQDITALDVIQAVDTRPHIRECPLAWKITSSCAPCINSSTTPAARLNRRLPRPPFRI